MFGEVLSGQLEVTAAASYERISVCHRLGYDECYRITITASTQNITWIDPSVEDEINDGTEIFCLYLGTDRMGTWSLLLRPLNGVTDFERVGVAKFYSRGDFGPDSTEIRRFRIL